MTRQELYELIWKEPITHAAKRFGISDVALRKTCVRHGIPTPPVGYWAKLAHGKAVPKVPLPPLQRGESDRIRLEPRTLNNMPEQISAALASVRQDTAESLVRIVVPKEKPEILHPAARELAAILRKSREDDIGLLHWNSVTTYHPFTYSVSISRPLIDRATILLDALFKTLVTCGHTIALETGIRVSVDGEIFDLSLREEYLTDKANAYDAYRRLEQLWTILQPQMTDEPNDQAHRIIKSLGHQLEADRQQFTASTLEGEARELGLFTEDDRDDVL